MSYFDQETAMGAYIEHFMKEKKFRQIKDRLIFLKGFSFSVPMLRAPIDGMSYGGGFYVSYDNTGIIIDPGMDFVNLFHQSGRFIGDVSYVIITHNHLDHVADLKKIMSLNYEYNKYLSALRDIPVYPNYPEHKIVLYCDDKTCDQISENELRDSKFVLCKISESMQLPLTIPCSLNNGATETEGLVSFFKVNHDKNIDTYALKIEVDGYQSLGYSSDAEYSSGLKKFLNTNIVILNISEVGEDELKDKRKLKKNHLGFQGCCKICKSLKSKGAYIYISEFCCLKGINVWEIMEKLRDTVKYKYIFPATINTNINIADSNLYCMMCGKSINPSDIYIINQNRLSSSVMYACKECVR